MKTMKIEYERESKIPFEDVEFGEVFEYNDGIYMKIDSTDVNGTALDVNAVHLRGAELYFIPSYSEVKILDATLRLRN